MSMHLDTGFFILPNVLLCICMAQSKVKQKSKSLIGKKKARISYIYVLAIMILGLTAVDLSVLVRDACQC